MLRSYAHISSATVRSFKTMFPQCTLLWPSRAEQRVQGRQRIDMDWELSLVLHLSLQWRVWNLAIQRLIWTTALKCTWPLLKLVSSGLLTALDVQSSRGDANTEVSFFLMVFVPLLYWFGYECFQSASVLKNSLDEQIYHCSKMS